MSLIEILGGNLVHSFNDVGWAVVSYLPIVLSAVLVFIAGWVIASFIGRVIAQVISALKIDHALRQIGIDELLERGGFRLNSGMFVGELVKWFIIVVFLLASVDILGLQAVTDFLKSVLQYLPHVFIASIILVLAAVVSQFVKRLIVGSAKAGSLPSAHLLGGIAYWAIWIFAILEALGQLGIQIGHEIANNLAIGVIGMMALAGGLAFGLGGKEAAARYIEQLRGHISEK